MNNNAKSQIIFTMIAILIGFVIGAFVLMLANINPIEAYEVLWNGIVSRPKYIAFSIIYATPLILTGLAVVSAFKTGLFNIGVEGQYIMGSLATAMVGILVDLPAMLHIPLCIMAGVLAGGIWAGIAGFLKAKYQVNEVITTIMLNWIAFYLSNFVVYNEALRQPGHESTKPIRETAMTTYLGLKDLIGPATKIHYGIIIAVIAVILLYIVLYKTTLGYELRAVGLNSESAKYGGINIKKATITAMSLSGALAGLAGSVQVLGVTHRVNLLAAQEGYGFDGISVALIGGIHPIGSFFAALFYGSMKYGGAKLNSIGAPTEIITILIGTIIYFIATAQAVRIIYQKIRGNKHGHK